MSAICFARIQILRRYHLKQFEQQQQAATRTADALADLGGARTSRRGTSTFALE